MNGEFPIGDDELHAYLDGALDADRAQAVAKIVEADPDLAARLAAFEADKKMFKTVYGSLADRPVPSHWLAMAQETRPAHAWRRAAIAALLLVGLAASAGHWARQPPAASREIVQAAIDARQGSSGRTIEVQNDANYDGVISDAVSMHVKVPNLARLGYRLSGIRLFSGAAAELLYRDKEDRLFTLYLRRSDGEARFDQFERAGLRVCIWQDDQLGMVMAGNVSTAAMQRLASLAYTGLTS